MRPLAVVTALAFTLSMVAGAAAQSPDPSPSLAPASSPAASGIPVSPAPLVITPFPEFAGRLSPAYQAMVAAGEKPGQIARAADDISQQLTIALLSTIPDPCYYFAYTLQWAIPADIRHIKDVVDGKEKKPVVQAMMNVLSDDIASAATALQAANENCASPR